MAIKSIDTNMVAGIIIDQQRAPLRGLTVRAFNQGPKTPDTPLGKPAVTNASGQYEIGFTEKEFQTGGPNVFIRVFDGDRLLGESPAKRKAKKRTSIDMTVEYTVKGDPNVPKMRVFGVVRDADGDLLSRLTVQAFDRDLRSEQ